MTCALDEGNAERAEELDARIKDRYLKGDTYDEIAAALGITRDKVRHRVRSMHRYGEVPYRARPNRAFTKEAK